MEHFIWAERCCFCLSLCNEVNRRERANRASVALAAALAVGVLKGLGVLFLPRLSMVLIFLIMAGVLIVRSLGREAVGK